MFRCRGESLWFWNFISLILDIDDKNETDLNVRIEAKIL